MTQEVLAPGGEILRCAFPGPADRKATHTQSAHTRKGVIRFRKQCWPPRCCIAFRREEGVWEGSVVRGEGWQFTRERLRGAGRFSLVGGTTQPVG